MAKKATAQTSSQFAGPLSRRDLIKALAIAAAASKTVTAAPTGSGGAKARSAGAARGKKKAWIGHGAP